MSLDRPQARIPIAYVTIKGERYECEISRHWLQYMLGVFTSLGGTSGLDVSSIDAGSYAAMQPLLSEAGFADLMQAYASSSDTIGEAMQGMPYADQYTDVLQADCMQAADFPIFQG